MKLFDLKHQNHIVIELISSIVEIDRHDKDV